GGGEEEELELGRRGRRGKATAAEAPAPAPPPPEKPRRSGRAAPPPAAPADPDAAGEKPRRAKRTYAKPARSRRGRKARKGSPPPSPPPTPPTPPSPPSRDDLSMPPPPTRSPRGDTESQQLLHDPLLLALSSSMAESERLLAESPRAPPGPVFTPPSVRLRRKRKEADLMSAEDRDAPPAPPRPPAPAPAGPARRRPERTAHALSQPGWCSAPALALPASSLALLPTIPYPSRLGEAALLPPPPDPPALELRLGALGARWLVHRVPGGHLSDSLAERLALLFEAALALPENGGRRGALVLAGGATVGMGWGLPRLTGIHVVVQVAP
ncbi:hypothetical protein TeGR_g11305, partial [Tetraparma gracilis]